jgi:hypothetical protein
MKPTAPSRISREHVCHDSLARLISFSLGETQQSATRKELEMNLADATISQLLKR